MTTQQTADYNKIIEDFNNHYTEVNKHLRLGQAFYNKHNDTIYNNQPNPVLFYEEDNTKALRIILEDIEKYVTGTIYVCEEDWYIKQTEDEKRMLEDK